MAKKKVVKKIAKKNAMRRINPTRLKKNPPKPASSEVKALPLDVLWCARPDLVLANWSAVVASLHTRELKELIVLMDFSNPEDKLYKSCLIALELRVKSKSMTLGQILNFCHGLPNHWKKIVYLMSGGKIPDNIKIIGVD